MQQKDAETQHLHNSIIDRSSSNHKESSLSGCIGSLSAGDFVCSPQMPHHQAEVNDNRQHTTDPDIQQLNITIWTHNQKIFKAIITITIFKTTIT